MDAASFLRVQLRLFRWIGIDLNSASNAKDRSMIMGLSISLMAPFAISLCFGIKENMSNMSILTFAMGLLLAATVSTMKYLLFIYYRKDFVGIIDRIRNILAAEMAISLDAVTIVEKENSRDQLLSRTYSFSLIGTGTLGIAKPLFIMAWTYIITGSSSLLLPHPVSLPWDTQVIYTYAPTFLWHTLISYIGVLTTLCVDTLLFSLTYNVCAIFKIAQHRVVHMAAATPAQELRSLVDVVQLHEKGLCIANQLYNYFRLVILIQFFIATMEICFSGFVAAETFPDLQSILLGAFLMSLLIQLFIYSYCSEHVKDQSLNFAVAVYDSPWYDYAPTTRRMLLVALMRSQRPCQLNGYFFDVNMEILSAIVRTAMSYIMMLRRFSE